MKFINFGSINIDYTFEVESIVRPGQTISSVSEHRFPGGKGLNQSIAAARAGAKVCHAGMMGDDGMFLKELMESSGVDCSFVKETGTGTGKAFIQVESSGQNCIVLSGGANQCNTHDYCDEVLKGMGSGDWLLLQNEINCIDYLIERASEKGISVVLNPSPMDEKVLKCDLDKVSMFIMNEDEGCRITGETSSDKVLDRMKEKYPGAKVVLTLGTKGSVYSYKDEGVFQPCYKVQAVDTTGAGDTFTGYFLTYYMEGRPVKTCLGYAAWASALAVGRPGAASAIPCREEVEQSFCQAQAAD